MKWTHEIGYTLDVYVPSLYTFLIRLSAPSLINNRSSIYKSSHVQSETVVNISMYTNIAHACWLLIFTGTYLTSKYIKLLFICLNIIFVYLYYIYEWIHINMYLSMHFLFHITTTHCNETSTKITFEIHNTLINTLTI